MRGVAFILFIIGLFSETQIRLIGSIGLSELVIFMLAPIIFFQDYSLLKHDKFMPLIRLGLLCVVGSIFSSLYNETPFHLALRGFASMYSLFAYPVMFHRLLRNNFSRVGWLFLGIAFSSVITIFAFQNACELFQYSGGVVDSSTSALLASGQLFWLQHFGMFPVLPVYCAYFSTPLIYSAIAPLIITVYTILTSASGRSAIMVAMLSTVLILIGRRDRRRMLWMQKHFIMIVIISIGFVMLLGWLYKYAGSHGLLTEAAQGKYELQMTKVNKSGSINPLQVIMAGRLEFFVGLYACLQRPIYGYGPWAIDVDGIYGEFLMKYGNVEDFEAYEGYQQYCVSTYGRRMETLIPGHSHLVSFWLTGGIFALPYWLYVLYLIWGLFRKRLVAIPQWFGYFACMVPSMLWNIFFSPYAPRIGTSVFLVMLLFSRAVSLGRIRLPGEMALQIAENE